MTRCDWCRKRQAHMMYRLVHGQAVVPLCEICAERLPDRPAPIVALG